MISLEISIEKVHYNPSQSDIVVHGEITRKHTWNILKIATNE